ncbi:MAG: ATP-binding protein [Actinomycetota bacterium]|nr:ATP-binding protein [Actinomycetota bacterium]
MDGVVLVNDVETTLARLSEEPAGAMRTVLAVVGPDVDHPLSVALELQRAHDALAFAFVVEPSAAEALEIRLGLVPELRGATVIAAQGSVEALRASLDEAAVAAARRHQVRGALDEMNRQLLDTGRSAPSSRESVSESYLAALVRHLPDAIVSVDTEASVVALNRGAMTTFRTGRVTAEGQTLSAVLGPAGEQIRPLVDDALAGRTRRAEVAVGTADGRLVVSLTVAPVRDHAERVVGAVAVARDITDARRNEDRLRELQKAQSLATLAGGVAHDFNNLLVTVNSWAELAAEDPGDAEVVATALEQIQTSARRAAELARSMLVYSGRGRFQFETVDMTALLREMAALLRGAMSRKVEMRLELVDELPPVEGDASQLRQVVMNLVTNAAEALSEHTGTITVRTSGPDGAGALAERQELPSGRYIAVEVADTGPGMDETTMERVFEPFFTTKFEGRGLGLAASHGIVRAHGGVLTVDSEPGHGATFRMLLPALDKGGGQ